MKQYQLRAMDTRSQPSTLTTGKIYTTLYGIEKDTSDNIWKFPDYVTVIADNHLTVSLHADRFEIIGEIQ